MNPVVDLLMNLIKSEIFNSSFEFEREITEEELNSLYNISKKHDITQILVSKLEEFSALKSEYAVSEKFKKALLSAVYRYERSNFDLESILKLFEQEHIDHLVLKGAVLRGYYSEPFLRTSSDIDILIKEEDLDRATNLLINKACFRLDKKEQYDISFFSPTGGHFELHFNLIQRGFKEHPALSNVWNGSEIKRLSGFEYGMTHELFLLYHVYHMAKHFVGGGCGIKPLIDLWIIKNKMGYDEEKVTLMLKEIGLFDFYQGILDLAAVWFCDREHRSVTKEIEDFILKGGAYGVMEQRLAMSQNREGGKFRYLLSRIFLSYKEMLVYYPSLSKCPMLYPFYQVRRWFKIAFCGGRKHALDEMRLNQSLASEKKERAKTLINALGLN